MWEIWTLCTITGHCAQCPVDLDNVGNDSVLPYIDRLLCTIFDTVGQCGK